MSSNPVNPFVSPAPFVYSQPMYTGAGLQLNIAMPFSISTSGPSWSLGNDGGWNTFNLARFTSDFGARGITQNLSMVSLKKAVGDHAGFYCYSHSDGGPQAASDEGTTGMTMQTGETGPGFIGTVAIGGKGATSVSCAQTGGNPWMTDGGMLLNISKGAIAGRLNGPSVPLPLGEFLNYIPVRDVTLPQTTAWGKCVSHAAPVIGCQNVPRSVGNVVTLTMTMLPIGNTVPAFVAGEYVSVAGSSYPEQSRIITASPLLNGQQTITLYVSNPAMSVVIFQGGIAGQYISFDANLALSAMRSSYFAFGSLTGTDLIYGKNIAGSLLLNFIPVEGSEAAECQPPTDPTKPDRSGFHLYPGAEVVCNGLIFGTPMLEPNSVEWDPGDVVNMCHFPVFSNKGLYLSVTQNSPTDPSYGSQGAIIDVMGCGVAGGFTPFLLRNFSGWEQYRSQGGPLTAPSALNTFGLFHNLIYVEHAPEVGGALIEVNQTTGPGRRDLANFNWSTGGHFWFDDTIGSGTWGCYEFEVGTLTSALMATKNLQLDQAMQPFVNPTDLSKVGTVEITLADGSTFCVVGYKK